MKIALIHPRLTLKGGLETRLFNYIKYFRERGDEVNIITYKVPDNVKIPEGVRILKIDLSLVPKPARMFFFNTGLKKVMRENKFDFSLSLGRTAYQDAVLCPGNHLGYLKAMNIRFPSPVDFMNIYLDKKAFKNSQVILAASQMMKSELENLYHVNPEKIKVVYPPLDVLRFNFSLKKEKDKWREKYGFSRNKKIFLINSSSPHIKNLRLALSVFRKLENESVELVGFGDTFQSTQKNVRSLGFCKEMQELYAAADFTIHPSKYEPFGQVITESIACGTPVIISNKTAAKEIISLNEGIVVKDFEMNSWVNAIKKGQDKIFSISPLFSEEHQLALDEHMKKITAAFH